MDIIKNYDALSEFIFGEGDAVLEKCSEGISVKNRKEKYSSLAAHIDKFLGPCEAYKTRFVLKTGKGSVPVAAYHKITIEYIGLEYTVYDYGKSQTVTSEDFSYIEVYTNIPSGAVIKDVIAYFIQGSNAPYEDITVKEFEASEAEPVKSVTAVRSKTPLKRQENMTVGVIRWDAYAQTGVYGEKNPSDQVARALSPAKYHFMAPFFSRVTGKDKIEFPPADQAQFDREAELAVKAGIDYFAYCWYNNSGTMSYARRQHINSKYADRLKMCAIIAVSALDDETIDELADSMTIGCYLKFDNRPVIYVYDAFKANSVTDKVLSAVKRKGIKEEPYLIGMADVNPFIVNNLLERGMDAISAYSQGSTSADEPYRELAKQTEKKNADKYTFADKIDVVPLICCGRDTRPRIETPVSWANHGYGGNYTLQPAGAEIYEHTKHVLESLKNSVPNTCIAYAWNEHDEGGWCCPTLAVDAEGEPIYDIDGNAILNSTNLNAMAKAIREFRQRGQEIFQD